MEIQEGLVVGNCSLAYDRNARFFKINALTLASTSASLRVDQMVIPTLGSPETMQGQYAVRADLGRVSQWMKDSKNATWVVGGHLEGNGQLSMQSVGADGEPLGFDFNGRVKDLSVSRRSFPSPAMCLQGPHGHGTNRLSRLLFRVPMTLRTRV